MNAIRIPCNKCRCHNRRGHFFWSRGAPPKLKLQSLQIIGFRVSRYWLCNFVYGPRSIEILLASSSQLSGLGKLSSSMILCRCRLRAPSLGKQQQCAAPQKSMNWGHVKISTLVPLLFHHLHLFTTQRVSTLQPVQTDACQIVPGVRIWRVWSSSWHSLVVSRGYKLKSGLLQTCPNISTHHKTPELPWITRIFYRTMPKYMATHATTHLHEWSYPARWIPTVCWLAGAEVRFHA